MKHYGLIGGRLEHSFSPQIHVQLGDYEYKLYPLKPEEIGGFMRESGLDGFNVTIPYKLDVIPYCTQTVGAGAHTRKREHGSAQSGRNNTRR